MSTHPSQAFVLLVGFLASCSTSNLDGARIDVTEVSVISDTDPVMFQTRFDVINQSEEDICIFDGPTVDELADDQVVRIELQDGTQVGDLAIELAPVLICDPGCAEQELIAGRHSYQDSADQERIRQALIGAHFDSTRAAQDVYTVVPANAIKAFEISVDGPSIEQLRQTPSRWSSISSVEVVLQAAYCDEADPVDSMLGMFGLERWYGYGAEPLTNWRLLTATSEVSARLRE